MSETDSVLTFEYGESLVSSEQPSIRLIKLQPSKDFEDDIHIELYEYTFDEDCPEFETLSYVWGDATDRMIVWCNDLAFEITTSLGQALRQLRSSTARRIWCDQICINQSDGVEKTYQVGLMRDIYQRSARTLAWLGPEDEAISITFACFKRLSMTFTEAILSEDSVFRNMSNKLLDDVLAASREPEKYFGGQPPTLAETRKINKVLSNRWFSRMWIVQEIAVSRQLVLIGGSLEIYFDVFAIGLFVLQNMNAETRQNNRIDSGHFNMNNLIKIRGAHHKRLLPARNRQLALPHLLAQCCLFQASDFRDRFYALYGLTSTDLARASLSASYTTAPMEALGRAAVNTLRYDKSLRLLELAECKGVPGQPSWIPGPRSTADPKIFPLSKLAIPQDAGLVDIIDAISRTQSDVFEEKYPEFNWDAYNETISELERDKDQRADQFSNQPTTVLDYIELEDPTTLCLKGQLLDRIEELSPVVLLPAALSRGYGCRDHEVVDFFGKLDAMDDVGDSVSDVAKVVVSASGTLMKFAGNVVGDWKMYNDANVKMDAMVTNRKQSMYKSRNELITAYRNTVCAGQWNLTSDGQRCPTVAGSLVGDMSDEEATAAFEAWRSTISGGVRINNLKSMIGLKGRAGLGSLLSTSLSAHSGYSLSYKIMTGSGMSSLWGRRLAWTASGSLALVPAMSEPGDMLFFLGGGDMPFVLRPAGGVFQLLGPTYLDGYMNGELADIEPCGIVKLI